MTKQMAKTRVSSSVIHTSIVNHIWSSTLYHPECTHLVVDEVDHGMFQHLRGLGQSLHSCGLIRVHLCGWDLYTLWQSLRKHGRPHTLWPSLVQLLVDVWRTYTKFLKYGMHPVRAVPLLFSVNEQYSCKCCSTSWGGAGQWVRVQLCTSV